MNYMMKKGLETAAKLADYLKYTDFSDFAPYYYKQTKSDPALSKRLDAFIEVMIDAGIHPFVELNQRLDHLQMVGLIQLIVSPSEAWLFENKGPKAETVEPFKRIGIEAWLFKPANRVMYIIPEKADIYEILDRIKALEEAGLGSDLASSNIEDWQKL